MFVGAIALGCENDSIDQQSCSIPATIRDRTGIDGCGFVFELADGSDLKPILPVIFCATPPLPKEITEDPLYNFDFVDGKKVLISYDEKPMASTCAVSAHVKITCITTVPPTAGE